MPLFDPRKKSYLFWTRVYHALSKADRKFCGREVTWFHKMILNTGLLLIEITACISNHTYCHILCVIIHACLNFFVLEITYYSSIPRLQRRFSQTAVEVRTWMSNYKFLKQITLHKYHCGQTICESTTSRKLWHAMSRLHGLLPLKIVIYQVYGI